MIIHIEFKGGRQERWLEWLISTMRELLEDECPNPYEEDAMTWTLFDGTIVRWWQEEGS